MNRLAIVGSRNFQDYLRASSIFEKYFVQEGVNEIISGGAYGADDIARQLAENFGIKYQVFPADWSKYGKKAGVMRNEQIIQNCDFLLAFWDGKSKGTQHTIRIAKENKVDTLIIYF